MTLAELADAVETGKGGSHPPAQGDADAVEALWGCNPVMACGDTAGELIEDSGAGVRAREGQGGKRPAGPGGDAAREGPGAQALKESILSSRSN